MSLKSETPKVNDLLGKLLDERGEVCERNAPEVWVKLARELERRLTATNKALGELHIVCETSKPEIFDWYLTDQFASEARKNAIEILLANRAAESANAELSDSRPL